MLRRGLCRHLLAARTDLLVLSCCDRVPAWVVLRLLLPLVRGLCWLACRVGPKGER